MLNYVIPMEFCFYYGCYYGITFFFLKFCELQGHSFIDFHSYL